MVKALRTAFICIVLAVVNHALATLDQETPSLSDTTSKDNSTRTPRATPGGSAPNSRDGPNNAASGSKTHADIIARRLIVRFPYRTKPVPFDEIDLSKYNSPQDDNMGVIVKRLKSLKTYIIEVGEGNSLDEVKRLEDFLISEGGKVEKDAVAILSGISDKSNTETSDSSTDAQSPTTERPPNGDVKNLFSKDQWYIELLEINRAWNQMRKMRRKPVKVCIVDTGIDYHHDALQDAIELNEMELNGIQGVDDDDNGLIDDIYGANFVDNNMDPMDLHGHGTSLAGIIAAKYKNPQDIAGINTYARLIPCKAFDSNLEGYLSDVLQCIDYCLARGAMVQNHSWTHHKESDALKNAFAVAETQNVLMVVSVGNIYYQHGKRRNIDNHVVVPAMYSKYFLNVLTVSGMQVTSEATIRERVERCKLTKPDASCEPSKDLQYELYHKSQFGLSLSQLVAPAYSIHTLWKNNSKVIAEGVSMATAIVTGVASLLLSIDMKFLQLTSVSVTHYIRHNIMPLPALKNKVRWGGYVNCRATVISMVQYNRALSERHKRMKAMVLPPRKSDKVNIII